MPNEAADDNRDDETAAKDLSAETDVRQSYRVIL